MSLSENSEIEDKNMMDDNTSDENKEINLNKDVEELDQYSCDET